MASITAIDWCLNRFILQQLGNIFVEGFDRTGKANAGKFNGVSGSIDLGKPQSVTPALKSFDQDLLLVNQSVFFKFRD
jgi:hypothetical protein